MSFLFVDRILRMDEGRFIQGVKQVTPSDSYLCSSQKKTHSELVLMTSVIGEILGQLGAWCVMHANQFTGRPVAGVVSAVHVHDEARVGETLLLETTIDSLDEAVVQYHAIATVEKRPIFTIENALGPILPMGDFIDPEEAKRQFHKIYRPGEMLTYTESSSTVMAEGHQSVEHLGSYRGPFNRVHVAFDTILSWVPGESVVAKKSLSLSEPYLVDHFPRKPVLPLTILLQAKLMLATHFLRESFEDGQYFEPVTVQKVKMNEFVQPGDSVITKMRLKEKTEERAVIAYHSEVAGKRVCVAEAIFHKVAR